MSATCERESRSCAAGGTVARQANRCRWIGLSEALDAFVSVPGKSQSQAHIRPLHWYVACRLVVEGGFHPDDIVPRPPFSVRRSRGGHVLVHDPESAAGGELTVLGGLKTKDVDVVVSKPGIGPCVAVSIKGTLNAFRNLTNRMEEAVGDCTNLHISYPNLVYGFLHVIRANREGPLAPEAAHFLKADDAGNVAANDIAVRGDGGVVESIVRYHDVLLGLAGRVGVRNDISRYEALALAMIDPASRTASVGWPAAASPLRIEGFMDAIYRAYDQRYVYAAPKLSKRTARLAWRSDSTALEEAVALGFVPRTDV
jgi:hypothetical protein